MRVLNRVVIIAALGTFVDVVDLTLFQNVRVASLKDLGVPAAESFAVGVTILNAQLAGMLIGGLLWGSLADRRGRKAVLFASILVYALATLACAWVTSVPQYVFARFICGFGLAGEFGAGVALIAEVLPPETRGYGTTLCAAFGLTGALAGAGLASFLPWRTCYIVGGCGGLVLLAARAKTFESDIFHKSRNATVQRGLLALFTNGQRLWRYALSLAIALPLFFVILTIVPFAPELAGALDPPHKISVPVATSAVSAGLAIGDIGNGLLSQKLKSRKRPMLFSIALITVSLLTLLYVPLPSAGAVVALIFLAGLGAGYFVLFLTNAAEQFGTNVRGSATVIAPNIMRGCVIPMGISLRALKGAVGLRSGSLIIGAVCVSLALLALRSLPETFGRDLDFDE